MKILREVADGRVERSKDIGAKYGETFDKLSYQLGEEKEFQELYKSSEFKKFIKQLTPQDNYSHGIKWFCLNAK